MNARGGNLVAVQVNVHGGNGEKAIRDLKRKMQRELVFRLMKMSRFYEPPSVKKVRKEQETERRIRKNNRRRRLEG
jgi:small subunit ribosomal protein S21